MRRLFMALAASVSFAGVAQAAPAGRIVLVQGKASVRRADEQSTRLDASAGLTLEQGDQLRTERDTQLRILLSDNSILQLGANTWFTVKRHETSGGAAAPKTRRSSFKLWSGRVWARVSKMFDSEGDNQFAIETPNAVAGVRGTEFVVDVAPNGATLVTVLEGAVAVDTEGAVGQVFGPSTQANVGGGASGGGAVQTAQTSPAQLATVMAAVVPKLSLDARTRDQRVARMRTVAGLPEGAASTPASAPATAGAPASASPVEEVASDLDTVAPVLDLDPGSGNTRLRGHVVPFD